jgi:DNA polymerase elongation subunit (family B)
MHAANSLNLMTTFAQALNRILDARQLGLKYIANVTYGYTSATYSGRMPAVEIADSIVQSGRETLEKVSVPAMKFHTNLTTESGYTSH